MKSTATYRVAVSGDSSLLGKEVLSVLGQRNFPVSRLVSLKSDEEEPDLPILDLDQSYEDAVTAEDINAEELDFVFLAARPSSASEGLSFLRDPSLASSQCTVIDLVGALPEFPEKKLSIPFLDGDWLPDKVTPSRGTAAAANFFVSAHPATIMISSLLVRLQAQFPLKSSVAHVFVPASEIGSIAIEELQRQTVNLLSFQKIPSTVFGGQLAFNLLPRLGRSGGGAPTNFETRLRNELRDYLGSRVPLPALRLFHVPVFHSLGISLYLETAEPVRPEALAQVLEGERVRLRRPSQHAPSQVEAAGSSDILVDAITPDPDHRSGIWIWAVADNVCLAALNAVEIAESLVNSDRLRSGQPTHKQ